MSSESAFFKRVKRHLIGPSHRFFVVTPPGMENLCHRELKALNLSLENVAAISGGVFFEGRLTDCYQAHLHLRTPVRILMRVARFRATNFESLQKHLARIPWELYLNPSAQIEVRVSAKRSRLFHSGAVIERVQDAVQRQLQAASTPPQNLDRPEPQGLWVRLQDDTLTLSLDASGAPLYQRGIQHYAVAAPLRENLAAAILKWAGYTAELPLLDGMCGSGTFAREAALMACAIPAGYYRSFAFEQWPAFKPSQWGYLKKQAAQQMHSLSALRILAADLDPGHCQHLREFAQRYEWASGIEVQQTDFFELQPRHWSTIPGLVVLNPPYGLRLGHSQGAQQIYKRIGQHLKQHFGGWRYAVILPYPAWQRYLEGITRVHRLAHGGLQARVVMGRVG